MLADGAVAFTARAVGNLGRPFYPDGVQSAAGGAVEQAGRGVEPILHRTSARPGLQRARAARRLRCRRRARRRHELHGRERVQRGLRSRGAHRGRGERHSDLPGRGADLSRSHAGGRHRCLRRRRGPGRHDRFPRPARSRCESRHAQQCPRGSTLGHASRPVASACATLRARKRRSATPPPRRRAMASRRRRGSRKARLRWLCAAAATLPALGIAQEQDRDSERAEPSSAAPASTDTRCPQQQPMESGRRSPSVPVLP